MRENITNQNDTKRASAEQGDIKSFDELAQEFKLNGYKEKHGLELYRDRNNFIIKIGPETIYLPLWHTITVKKDRIKSEIDITVYIKELLKKYNIELLKNEK